MKATLHVDVSPAVSSVHRVHSPFSVQKEQILVQPSRYPLNLTESDNLVAGGEGEIP